MINYDAEGEGNAMKLRFRLIILLTFALMLIAPFIVTQVRGNNQTPVASFTYLPLNPAPEETITFNASTAYDPDGYIAKYSWNFGDGNTTALTTPIITHTYPVDGNYTVELTVIDNGGLNSVSSAVIQVSTVAFFRVCYYNTLIPMPDVEVTAYYFNGSAWLKAPVGSHGLEIKYDRVTQPNLANSALEKYRNPGYTASILRQNASNIGFDLHPSCWTVYFKFTWGSFVAYWPNNTARVYSYNYGTIETHDYLLGHRAYWDPAAAAYVIRVGDIPGHGVSPCESHPIIVQMGCPPPQNKYYLSVKTDPTGIPTISGEGWYYKNTNVTLTAPTYVDVSSDTRYRFSYWDVDGTSKGSGVNPITVCMSANHTAKAHYVTQYSVVFSQTGVSSDATGTIVTANSVAKYFADLPYALWVDKGNSVTYSYSSTVSSSTSGKQFRLSSVTGSASPITVNGPACVKGNYVVQYKITFAQTGLDISATGTVVTVNGTAKIYGDLPYDWWVDCGATVTYTYSSIIASTVSGKQFRLTGVNCPPSQFIVSEPATITGVYCKQYKVTFAQTGLDSTASGTVVTVNGNAKSYSQLPYSFWVDSGSTVTYAYSNVSSSTPNKQFRLTSVSGPASPITVTAATTVTGVYCVQYKITFTQSGLDSTATGTVVTVNGVAKSYGQLPYSFWVDSGSTVTYAYSNVSSTTTGKRFRLTSVSGSSSPFTVTGCTTVTGNYKTQYKVTFAHTGLDSTATGTVVTVNGTAKTYSNLPYDWWVDCGATVTYSYSSTVLSSTSGKQFRLSSVSGSSSPITVTAPTTVTGNYVTQYSVTFTHTGLDATATGTVVSVNGNAKVYTDLPFVLWVDSGSSVTYSFNSIVLSTTTGKQFNLTSISGPASPITVSGVTTVTGNYKIQYKVTFDQSGVGSDFTGTIVTVDGVGYTRSGLSKIFWWDKDSSHTFSFASPLTVNATKQYGWSSTSGLSSLQNGTLTITTSGNVIGNYVVQNWITFDQVGVSSDFTGAIVIIDGTSYSFSQLPKSFPWQMGTTHTFAFQTPLVVSTNVKRYVWTSTTGLSTLRNGSITVSAYGSIIGHYKTQYYLNLATSPQGIGSPTGTGWYDSGAYALISAQQYVPGGSRYRFDGWTTVHMSEITDPASNTTTVLVDESKTVTANYVHQYLVTFKQTGLSSDASTTVVTVNGGSKLYGDLPYSLWVDQGDTVTYSYSAIVSSTTAGKQYIRDIVTGPSSPITVNADINATGNYKTQYCLTVSSPYGTTGGQGWYNSSDTAYATLNTGEIDHLNGTKHVFTNWNGDASGTNYASSNPITMDGAKIAVAVWKTQYNVTFTYSGLDSSASSIVVTVNGVPKTYGQLPYTLWVDSGSTVTYAYSNVSSATPGKQFILIGVTGLSSPITVTGPGTVTGNYKIQYRVTFSQSGVGSDYTGTVVTVDGTGYTVSTLPTAVFWWDKDSTHSFAFASPLIVDAGKQYVWIYTSGLTTLQNGTLTVTGSGGVTGNYATQTSYQITFGQSGVGPDFTGTVVIIDGETYKVSDLNCSFWWVSGTVHTFAFQSPLVVTSNIKQYVWNSTSGLSTSKSGSITVSASGHVIGNYKTQYYLTMATSPSAITTPSGEGWYYAGSYATISTAAYVPIDSTSQYRFNGWTTADMSEIADPTKSPTTVYMDKGKTVTALYATQYLVTFSQSGVGSDFSGTVMTIDGRDYNRSSHSFWWDKDSTHSFSFTSPLMVSGNVKRYAWTSTTGLSTAQSGTITISGAGNVNGNYKTQYLLTVLTDPSGLSPQPARNPAGDAGPANGWWYDASTSVSLTAQTVSGYTLDYWDVDGSAKPSGQNPISVTMGAQHTATAHYKIALSATIDPPSASIDLGDSVTFTVTPSGGTPGYTYQWYLNGNPVSGATSNAWTFTPTSSGYYEVYVKVTDSKGATAQSNTAPVQVSGGQPPPEGGYTVPYTPAGARTTLTYYTLFLALFAIALSLFRRKKK